MTDLLKAEVIGALRERLCAVRDAQLKKAGDFGAGWRAQYIEAIDSFDLTPFQVKVPEDVRECVSVLHKMLNASIFGWPDGACEKAHGLVESLAAQLAEAHKKYNDALIHATKAEQYLSAQIAERDREIAELQALVKELEGADGSAT